MTVSTDIQAATGAQIVGYIAIEGVEPLLFEYSDRGAPGVADGWTRPYKVCLNPPSEFTNEIDLGETTPQVSAMTFSLEDIKDADGTSFFGKMFATGRWTFNPHARMMSGETLQSQVDANADSIPLNALGSLSANSNGFITRESINWGDTNAHALLNVTKGLYPAVDIGSTYGYTYARPSDSARGYLPHVGSVGFAMNGRRVAYYITSWDRQTGAFNAESQSELVWTGKISNEIQYAGADSGTWKVACISITDELTAKSPAALPVGHLDKITIGEKGNSFTISVNLPLSTSPSGGIFVQSILVTVPAGSYTATSLMSTITKEMNDLSNTTYPLGSPVDYVGSIGYLNEAIISTFYRYSKSGATGAPSKGKTVFSFQTAYYTQSQSGSAIAGTRIIIHGDWNGETCHVLGALGWPTRGRVILAAETKYTTSPARYITDETSPADYHIAYHPLSRDYNGGKLNVSDADVFWRDQGDSNTSQACVKIEEATLAPYWNLSNKDGNYLARYSSRTTTGQNFLTLTTDPQPIDSKDGYVGQPYGKEQVEVQQVYIPHYYPKTNGTGSGRGPFELLLYPLLSSGTTGYNHAKYDKCPLDLSLAIQQELVDIPSFLQADKYALSGSAGLGHRKLYVIDKPVSWLELMKRECKLFGYVLCWRKGKLTLRPVLHSPGVDGFTETLGDNTRAMPTETPTVSMSTATVVNQYACKLKYDPRQDKFGAPIIITDVDSALSQGTKQIKIEHQGVLFDKNQLVNAQAMLKSNLLERWIRYPLPVVTQTLAPSYINRVFAGDIVKYTSSLIPDPYGSGGRTTNCLATVLGSTWNYRDGIGQVILMLHDRALASAWAPAALVDRTAAGGGFANAVDQIKMVPYTFTSNTDVYTDGNAVAQNSGWAVQIIERAPANVHNPAVFGPFNTTAAYYSGNHYIQLPVSTDLSGFDTTGNTEYIMTFADFPVINTVQYSDGKGTWQANSDTELLNDVNIAQVYK
jgi:hypothetical protein